MSETNENWVKVSRHRANRFVKFLTGSRSVAFLRMRSDKLRDVVTPEFLPLYGKSRWTWWNFEQIVEDSLTFSGFVHFHQVLGTRYMLYVGSFHFVFARYKMSSIIHSEKCDSRCANYTRTPHAFANEQRVYFPVYGRLSRMKYENLYSPYIMVAVVIK